MRLGVDQRQSALWTVDFVLNLLTAHFMFASYMALVPVVPLYVLDRGGEAWHVGVVVGSFGVIGLVIYFGYSRSRSHLGQGIVEVVSMDEAGVEPDVPGTH